jgi:hypothetical protein
MVRNMKFKKILSPNAEILLSILASHSCTPCSLLIYEMKPEECDARKDAMLTKRLAHIGPTITA